jgi:hypothetical protein
MPAELPIACSLSASELPDRMTEMAELGRDALLDARVDGARAQLRFAAGEGVRERVARFVEAESRCCAFLSFALAEAPDEVVLRIDAPAGAEGVLAELVAAFETCGQAARWPPDRPRATSTDR